MKKKDVLIQSVFFIDKNGFKVFYKIGKKQFFFNCFSPKFKKYS